MGDRHRTGAEAQSTPPPDAKGSGWVDEPPNYKTRLVVATLPSSRLLQEARCESRRGKDGTRGSPSPLWENVVKQSEAEARSDEGCWKRLAVEDEGENGAIYFCLLRAPCNTPSSAAVGDTFSLNK